MNSTWKSSSRAKPEPEPEPTVKKFLKIISLSTIKEKMMKIPPRFVRLGPKLFDTVTVETPAGFKRTIRIKRIGDEIWFENGWSEFAEAHSLSEGHILFFIYKGNSSFRVVIFDVSASEIKYPLDKVNVIDSDDDEEVIEIIDDEKDGFTVLESSDNDSKGVIDLEELVKKKPSFNINSETITIDDVEEIDSMDDVEEDKDILKEE